MSFSPRDLNVPWFVDTLERTTPPKNFLEQFSFSVVFGVAYCMLAKVYSHIKMWQGAVFGFLGYGNSASRYKKSYHKNS
nr:DUF1440 domain-containing protein [Campylobacter sp. MIT 97-5078]